MAFFKSIFGILTSKKQTPKNPSTILKSLHSFVSNPSFEISVTAGKKAGLILSPNENVFFNDTQAFVSKFINEHWKGTSLLGECYKDDHETLWIIAEHPEFKSLIEAVNGLSEAIAFNGLGTQMIAAVFSGTCNNQLSYWICNYRTSCFYPFVPLEDKKRHYELEMAISNNFKRHRIPVEPPSNWYPIWDAPI